jgi:hypothetical protein
MKSASWVCTAGYTFGMQALLWLVILACLAGIGVVLWLIARKQAVRRRESESRSAAILAEAMDALRAKQKK